MTDLAKTFEPGPIEARWYAHWEGQGLFRPQRKQAEPFTIVMPPPNVTGSLHIGHALDNTLQDILTRWHRMRGDDVLWQPGLDHAGIATQMVVERELAKAGNEGRREMGREAFLKKVWEWKESSGGTIVGQLKRLGASADGAGAWVRDLRRAMGEVDVVHAHSPVLASAARLVARTLPRDNH